MGCRSAGPSPCPAPLIHHQLIGIDYLPVQLVAGLPRDGKEYRAAKLGALLHIGLLWFLEEKPVAGIEDAETLHREGPRDIHIGGGPQFVFGIADRVDPHGQIRYFISLRRNRLVSSALFGVDHRHHTPGNVTFT